MFGSTWEAAVAGEIGAPLVEISYPATDEVVIARSYVGYRGALQLLERTYTTVVRQSTEENPEAARAMSADAFRPSRAVRVAIATHTGVRVSEHFGHATRFEIWEVRPRAARVSSKTRVNRPSCGVGADRADELMDASVAAVADCRAVVVARLGECAINRLDKLGILAFETEDPVDATVRQLGQLRRAVRTGEGMNEPAAERLPGARHARGGDDAGVPRPRRQASLLLDHGRRPRQGGAAAPAGLAGLQHRLRLLPARLQPRRAAAGRRRAAADARRSGRDDRARDLRLVPNLAVVGIAGPGDPLASDHAIETFARIHARWPELTLCVSTNGLMLPERVDELAAAGVTTLTVTVNSVDPEIQAVITPKIAWKRKRVNGVEAGRRLIDNQLAGIARAADLGLTIKINTVLIPTVNDHHIGDGRGGGGEGGRADDQHHPADPRASAAHLQGADVHRRGTRRAPRRRSI